jgi:hypothetical protein
MVRFLLTMSIQKKEKRMRRFFSRFFNPDKPDAGPSMPSGLSAPMTEAGLDSKAMEAMLAEIDLDTAIASHENWKLRLQNFLSGQSSEVLQAELVCQDNRCDLGKWLHGPGGQKLGRYPAFQVLIARHRYFHVQASTVVAQAQGGDIEKARQTLGASYRQASSQVILLLKQLKRGLQH